MKMLAARVLEFGKPLSILGTRTDLREALCFAERGHIRSHIETQPLGAINDIFTRLKAGGVQGRVVLQMS